MNRLKLIAVCLFVIMGVSAQMFVTQAATMGKTETMDKADSTETMSKTDSMDKTNSMGTMGKTETMDKTDSMGTMGKTDSMDKADSMGTEEIVARIYEDKDYGGNTQALSEGFYNIDDLQFGDDTLSSFKVKQGYTITLYQHKDGKGHWNRYHKYYDYVGDKINDTTSSILIKKK